MKIVLNSSEHVNRYLTLAAWFYVLCFFTVACSLSPSPQESLRPTHNAAHAEQRQTSGGEQDTGVMTQSLKGIYYGVSEDQGGQIVWIVYLDSETSMGRLYAPPANVKLSHIKTNAAGKVTFHLEDEKSEEVKPSIGGADIFDGYITQDGIAGVFKLANSYTIQVSLKKVGCEPSAGSIGGLYTNVKYVEDAGDLVGAELLLIPYCNGFIGAFTPYEGVPGNIYALIKPQVSGNNLQFAIKTNKGMEHFSGTIKSSQIMLKRMSPERDAEFGSLILARRLGVLEAINAQSTVVNTK